MVKKIVFVVTGGQIKDTAFLRAKIEEVRPIEIICADGGARYVYDLGLTPGVIIGDMDSLSEEMYHYFERKGCRIIRYPERKNETDTQLALEYAYTMGPDEVWTFGAFGTRIDHVLANIGLLSTGVHRGIRVLLMDEWCEVFVVTDECVIEGKPGQTVSLLPLTGKVVGIYLDGFEYPLEDGVMEMGVPYGVSNRLVTSSGRVIVRSGQLLIIRYHTVGKLP